MKKSTIKKLNKIVNMIYAFIALFIFPFLAIIFCGYIFNILNW